MKSGKVYDLHDLATNRIIAERCGVGASAVGNWPIRETTFPKPVWVFNPGARSTPVWYWPDVERWVKEHRPNLIAR